MLIIASFEQSSALEIAIANLEQNGVSKGQIFAAPFEKRREERQLFDSIHRSDGVSLLDLSAALATAFAVLGAIYGYILAWGPIIWGLIGFAVGALLGVTIDYFYTKKKTKNRDKVPDTFTETVLIVQCSNEMRKSVENILWSNLALGIAYVESSSPPRGQSPSSLMR